MSAPLDESRLDEPEELTRLDPGGMLRSVATAGAQVREALLRTEPDVVRSVAAEGRPRAVLVAGLGASGIAGDVLGAVAGVSCPVPLSVHKRPQLPGWAGPLDLVIAVSCSGTGSETLAVADEALRRGCRLVTVGRAGSPLSQRAAGGRAVQLDVDPGGRPSRANLWALSVPLLLLADALGLCSVPRPLLDRVADDLDRDGERCGPASQTYDNPAKRLALELAEHLPVLWGTSPLGGAAALRLACQLAENAKWPALHGDLPEVAHHQVVTLAGAFGAGATGSDDDLFRDRVEDGPGSTRLRLVLLRDTEEVPPVGEMREAAARVAESYGVPVTELAARGEHPVERLASLICPADFASVYLALAAGIDPTPIEPVVALKERLLP